MELPTDPALAASLGNTSPTTACKICGATARLHGVVDFNKNCEARDGRPFPLAGIAVWYHRCPDCGFLFTTQFDRWPADSFVRHIYNADYATVDPDAQLARASANLAPLLGFMKQTNLVSMLDYGGGNGALARMLSARGVAATSWDPLLDPGPLQASVDLVTAYEVLEHTPTPLQTCRQALSCLRPGGLMLFSTLTIDTAPTDACAHWYVAPRNGHLSIHTRASLDHLFAQLGHRLHHFNDLTHLAQPPGPPTG